MVDVPAGQVSGVEALKKNFMLPQVEGVPPQSFSSNGLISTAQPLIACTAGGVELVILSEEDDSSGSSSNLTRRLRRPAGGGSSATLSASPVADGAASSASGAGKAVKGGAGNRKYLGNNSLLSL